jgi:two-component system NtrC family response regulator
LLESELFGHRKGAFTGATRDRAGLFEIAGRGTLFLDEIGDMPINMQAKLLRVLQEGTFRRVGDEEERYSSCRVLSASNKRLDDLVKKQLFRQDLYYRLNVLQVDIPPLRERREDIPLLVEYLLALQQRDVILSPAAMAAMMDYDWPGNVRQLENEIMRAAVLCERGIIEPKVLTIPTARMMVPEKEKSINLQDEVQQAVRIRERQVIEAALKEAKYNVTTTAKRLGLHRVVLHRKIRNLGIELPERRKR